MSVEERRRGGLSRKEKKALGVLPRQVMKKARQMVSDGDIDSDMTIRELALVYVAELDEDTGGIDLDKLIAFLEKLFELLVKFLPLFAGL